MFAAVPSLAAPSLAPPGAPANVHPAVARIVAPGNGSVSYGSGTLVYVQDNWGLVVTNWHVINEATEPISVHFPDGFYSQGTIQRTDRDWDLALIAIRRPNAQPVSLAQQAPQPGEMLTIAGYGSGQYRAATGPCTQYVAPGTKFPFEMVELAASARQGDSGGPIFNSRGELAGVLFGEGHGRTSGSYCGRVRWFLTTIVPPDTAREQLASTGGSSSFNNSATSSPRAGEGTPLGIAPASNVQGRPDNSYDASAASVDTSSGIVASTRGSEPETPLAHSVSWEDIAGESLAEQAKTVLAAVGALALLLHVLSWMSREKNSAKR